VLPLAAQVGAARAVKLYQNLDPHCGSRVKVRKCECGAPLPPRKRVCSQCREKNRRAAYRESKRRQRRTA
jgi:hypothetical protein